MLHVISGFGWNFQPGVHDNQLADNDSVRPAMCLALCITC